MPMQERCSNRLDVRQHARQLTEFMCMSSKQMEVNSDAGRAQRIKHPLAGAVWNDVIVGAVQKAGRGKPRARVMDRARQPCRGLGRAITEQTSCVRDAGSV